MRARAHARTQVGRVQGAPGAPRSYALLLNPKPNIPRNTMSPAVEFRSMIPPSKVPTYEPWTQL